MLGRHLRSERNIVGGIVVGGDYVGGDINAIASFHIEDVVSVEGPDFLFDLGEGMQSDAGFLGCPIEGEIELMRF